MVTLTQLLLSAHCRYQFWLNVDVVSNYSGMILQFKFLLTEFQLQLLL